MNFNIDIYSIYFIDGALNQLIDFFNIFFY